MASVWCCCASWRTRARAGWHPGPQGGRGEGGAGGTSSYDEWPGVQSELILNKSEPAREVPRCVMTCLHTCGNMLKNAVTSSFLTNHTNL